jgi:hypothetical protein
MRAKGLAVLTGFAACLVLGACDNGRFGVVDLNQRPTIDGEIQQRFDSLFAVTFSVSARDPEGGELDYVWNFGDDTADQKAPSSVQHTYQRKGNFLVRVVVSDRDGGTERKTTSIQVKGDNQRPVARIIVLPRSRNVCVGDQVVLDGSTSSDPDNDDFVKAHMWNYETGTSSEKSPSVTFARARTYRVTLRVKDTFDEESFLESTVVCVEERPLCLAPPPCPEP